MSANPKMDILEALEAMLKTITRPTYRTNLQKVKIGLTAADLNDSEHRPFAAVIWSGNTPTMEMMRRHRNALRITIYVETADTETAMKDLVAMVEDVEQLLQSNEMLKTTAAPAGLLLMPIAITNEDAVLDLDASAGIGSARIDLDAVYRTTHS